MVPVSAKQRIGIDDLLENILLVAEVEELKANPNREARGVIIEANSLTEGIGDGRPGLTVFDAANGTARPLEADSDCASLGTEPSRSLSASDERRLRLGGGTSGMLCEECDDVARTVSRSRPVVPWHTRSEVPSACKPTTGRPEARASSTTCPKVSVNDGKPKMLLLAYIEARRLPFW